MVLDRKLVTQVGVGLAAGLAGFTTSEVLVADRVEANSIVIGGGSGSDSMTISQSTSGPVIVLSRGEGVREELPVKVLFEMNRWFLEQRAKPTQPETSEEGVSGGASKPDSPRVDAPKALPYHVVQTIESLAQSEMSRIDAMFTGISQASYSARDIGPRRPESPGPLTDRRIAQLYAGLYYDPRSKSNVRVDPEELLRELNEAAASRNLALAELEIQLKRTSSHLLVLMKLYPGLDVKPLIDVPPEGRVEIAKALLTPISQDSEFVLVTPRDDFYHVAGCRLLRDESLLSRQDAQLNQYRPCRVCCHK